MEYTEFQRFRKSALELPSNPSRETIRNRFAVAQTDDLLEIYTPFEYVTPTAKVAIVGITPGYTQVLNAIESLSEALKSGAEDENALKTAKLSGAFSGTLRTNLIALLESISLHEYLGIGSCKELFDSHSDLVQTCSVLKNAIVRYNRRKDSWDNYNGTPNIIKNDFLRKRVDRFAEEIKNFPKGIIYITLGKVVAQAFEYLASKGAIPRERIFAITIHPAAGNNERVAAWLERKPIDQLSAKTPKDVAEGYLKTKAELKERLKNLR